jgi:hypothetical protein
LGDALATLRLIEAMAAGQTLPINRSACLLTNAGTADSLDTWMKAGIPPQALGAAA